MIDKKDQGIAQSGQSARLGSEGFAGSNPATLTKFCNGCNLNRFKNEFSWRNKSKGTLQSICKFCFREQDKQRWKTDNKRKQSHKINRDSRRKENIRLLNKYLQNIWCIDCHETDSIVLEFDHKRDKKYDVSYMVHGGWSWRRIAEEIRKCDVVCANCHRRRTSKQFNWIK